MPRYLHIYSTDNQQFPISVISYIPPGMAQVIATSSPEIKKNLDELFEFKTFLKIRKANYDVNRSLPI